MRVVVVVVEGAVLVRGLEWTTTLTTADFLRWRRAVGSEGRLDWICDTTEKGFISVVVGGYMGRMNMGYVFVMPCLCI